MLSALESFGSLILTTSSAERPIHVLGCEDAMSKFLLTDWEINGYDDSDFMCSYYDDKTNTIGFTCYGSTRYPSATVIGIGGGTTSVVVDGENLLMPDADVVEKARLVLADRIFDRLQKADRKLVDEPDYDDLRKDLRVRLTEKARMQLRQSEPCQKCSGSGKWINPRNPNDKRDCFACKGSGNHVGGKVKGDDGKQVWEELPAGLAGKVVDWRAFGQFYANGYNKPGRHNTTVQFRTDAGKLVRASLSKLRLDEDYKDDSYLYGKAEELSYNYQFSALYPRFAWDTHNFAAEVAKKKAS